MSEFFEVLGIKEKSEKLKRLQKKEKELIKQGGLAARNSARISREYEKLDQDILGYAGKSDTFDEGNDALRLDDDGIDMDNSNDRYHDNEQLFKYEEYKELKSLKYSVGLIDYDDLQTEGANKATSRSYNEGNSPKNIDSFSKALIEKGSNQGTVAKVNLLSSPKNGKNLSIISYKFETTPKLNSNNIFETKLKNYSLDPNSHMFSPVKKLKIQKPVNSFLKRTRPHYEINTIKNKLLTVEEASGIFEKDKDPEKDKFMEDRTFWQLMYREDESSTLETYEAKKGRMGYLEVKGKGISQKGIEAWKKSDEEIQRHS